MENLFSNIVIDGPEHYAEPYDASTFVKMPFNCAINIIYPIIGFYWIREYFMNNLYIQKIYKRHSIYPLMLATLVCIYGPIQFTRIVTQWRIMGIIDQWITLPFFAIAFLWMIRFIIFFQFTNKNRLNKSNNKNKNTKNKNKSSNLINFLRNYTTLINICFISLSLASYLIACFDKFGFEITLAIHIISVVIIAIYILISMIKMTNNNNALRRDIYFYFLFATLSCADFVFLKVYDFEVTAFIEQFTNTRSISGHFLSKFGDVLQVHFTIKFMETCYRVVQFKSKKL
eukprot:TRINITY_DN530_c1_g1_i1.p1 TRINITY_DN530_c1_g1~~TRINITY_DN530_c1_g1_i1.p1  ORF type:complete len:287 (-),score=73.93 TRINITY_DN530_c1_g1_i1:85-945(-)